MHLRSKSNHVLRNFFDRPAIHAVLLAMTFGSLGLVAGCGSGYNVIAASTGTAVTINAGQTIQIPQATPGSAKWVLSGIGCNSNNSCGTIAPSGDSVTYTAPPAVTSQLHVVAATEDTNGKFEATVNPELKLTAALDDASVDTPYTATVSTSGGSTPTRLTLASGSLPDGLQFNASSGMLSGTPKVDGDFPVTFQATDASAAPTATVLHRTLRVRHRHWNSSVSITTPSLSAGTVNSAYSAELEASGGATPYAWSVASGSLPAGLALSQDGVISGTPTSAGTSSFAVQVTDNNGSSDSASLTLSVINDSTVPTTLLISSPAAGTVGATYTGTIDVSGGLAPYACSITSGSLPEGLSLNGCGLTGTPTTAGNYSLAITATDSSSPSNSSTANITINIAAAGAKLVIGAPAAATVGTIYNSAIAVSGGTGPYACSIINGTLPTGVTQNNCALTGTPTASGSFSLRIKATDSSSPANNAWATVSLVVNAGAGQLNLASPPAATVGKPYGGNIGIAGGTAPYTCSIIGGTLPDGLSLNGCVLAGTPITAGSYPLGVKVSDSSAATISSTGNIVVTVNAATATLVLTPPAAGTVGTAYAGTINVNGGTAPYTCAITSGTLPAGISQNNCTLAGTPTASGTFPLRIRATDSSSPGNSGTASVSLLVNAAAGQLSITGPTAATAGKAYSGNIGITGGTAPYTCSLASGTLPAGLVLNGCALTGTPTTAGTYSLGIKASDSSATVVSTTGNIAVRVNPATVTLTLTSPAAATVGTAYTGIIGVRGGTAPYTCSITSGALPAGITQNNCALTGTPTASGTFALGINATDSNNPVNSGSATVSLAVNAAAAQLSLSAPPAATVGTAYTGIIGVSGGTAPYTCSITSGTLPAGITQNNCALTGTPTASGSFALGIKATDSNNPVNSGSRTVSLVVNAAASQLALSSPPTATVGKTYNGSIGITGGTAPYTCSITSGTLPAGLNLNGCVLTGTPTTAGSYPLGIKASDSSATVVSTTGNVAVTVNAAAVTLTLSSPPAATVGTAYTGTIGVSGGTAPYSCTLASGTVPAGLTLNGCMLTGTPTTAGSATLSIKATDSNSPANATTANVTAVVNSASSTTPSGAPHINYTDLNVGSGTGGDTGNGVYVRIFGNHFGSSQGSSSITLGGPLVTNCSLCSWTDTQIIAQLGPSASTGQIVATVNGLQSNGVPFTVTPTTIVFVSPNGSDSNSGSFASPFKTWRAAFNSVTSNDSRAPSQNTVIYLEPGTDVTFDDGRAYKAAISTDIGGTSTTNQLSIVGYPGGTVNVGSTSIVNGVHGWANFVTIANLSIVGQVSAIDAEAGNVRIINNSLSCPAPPSGVGGTACVLGETTDPSETWVFQGNDVHDTGGNVDKTYHAVYFSSNVNHADVGWNNVGRNFKGYCRAIMFHATLGSNQYDLHVHDNIVTNSYCDGIALASVDPSQGTVEVYNNVVAHAALLLNPFGVANEAGIAINTDPAGSSSGNVEVYNNTVVDAGAFFLGNQNGCFGVVTSGAGMHLTNNICYQLLPIQPYIEKGSTNVSGSNNLWFGAGAAPTWDSAPITLNPLLLSPIFSLQPQSPASGNGTTSIMSPFDILGVPRGSRPSVGAYQ
jgi:hypothetical protein